MNEPYLKAENARLRREISQLRNELAELKRNKQPEPEYKIASPAPPETAKVYDPRNPVPGDAVLT